MIGQATSKEEQDIIFDNRRRQLGITMEALDAACSFPDNYSSKLLMKDKKKAGKRIGDMAFQRLNAALKIKWIAVEDD